MRPSPLLCATLVAASFAVYPIATPAATQASAPPTPMVASKRTPAAEIDALIDKVAHAKGVVFIRNGTEHTATEAAQHLARKRKAAGDRIKTPEQFIDKLGSRSSMTGKSYRVRLPDGREMDSATWMTGLLEEVRATR
ncbi:DUF5329 domain-containing protein [Lysobacter sp. A6]|uniref:DUF5329 domain-containing protein n=1 Tax=Noviluteimonas lactosilytica TaxID=2888523 RepID=A0ABS8JGJ7_9GAMM|nr:DUF5329 domain-containing protein [Lysobacter lactosilyticus]MCC8362736.1 DUF5329 domain-containing protein [Lysobacter lactosilyticus]